MPSTVPQAPPRMMDVPAEDIAAAVRAQRAPWIGELLMYAAIAALVVAAWRISRHTGIRPSDDIGYWLGVTGGSMMLLLLVYPMRKHLRFMHGWGTTKPWLWLHIALGIAGPLIILVHAAFEVRSFNAGVSLYSMLVVAASGIVGRFLKTRVHRGMHGEQATLRDLQMQAGFVQADTRTRLDFAPRVVTMLREFEARELGADVGWLTHLRQVFILPCQQAWTYLACSAELKGVMRELAAQREWEDADRLRRERKLRKLVRRYLVTVVRVAQYTAVERVFGLWHIAHVPIVYLLVASAVVHIVAVHAY